MFAVNAMCALVVEGVIIGVVSTQYDVIMVSPSYMHTTIMLSNNTLPTCRRVGPGQTACKFVLLRVRLN